MWNDDVGGKNGRGKRARRAWERAPGRVRERVHVRRERRVRERAPEERAKESALGLPAVRCVDPPTTGTVRVIRRIGYFAFQEADRARDQSLRVVCLGAVLRFERVVHRREDLLSGGE